jgi:hypothetical protein
MLRPVATAPERVNAEDVRRLTEWRNRYPTSFLTEFQATENRTACWLTEVVGPNQSKILFMVDDTARQTFGYMGLDFIDWKVHSAEADAIVRGGVAPPGTMMLALRTLLVWAVSQLGMKTINVRVLSDNPALEFYRKLGFHETQRIGLRRVLELDRVVWCEDASLNTPQRSLVYMTLPPERL